MRISRRHFLTGTLAGLGVAASAGSYMRWIESDWFDLTTTRIPRPGRSPLRVLHLSDLHASDVVPLEMIARAIELGLATSPHLIAVTGDFFTKKFADHAGYAALLAKLSAAAPTFACPGNHDGGRWVGPAGGYRTVSEISALLRAANITLLQNAGCEVAVAQQTVQLVGTGDLWAHDCHPGAAFAQLAPREDKLRLVLCHNPDAKGLLWGFDWDIMLCGHTHGGQLRLPLIGTPFAPVQDHRYVEGLHDWEGRRIFITRGVGCLHGLRFNCRPEISVLEIG